MKRPITIVLTGGGSGGHITPILSVALELKNKQPDWQLVYIGQKGDRLANLANNPNLDQLSAIWAGKLRRYHGQSLLAKVTDIRTQLLNLRDIVYILIGTFQALILLFRLKPAALLIKGGYVGVPVAWAARLLGIAYVTHDSDAVAGLANRLVSKNAAWHAVGMPNELYNYPKSKTSQTGVPISHKFHPVSPEDQKITRQELGIDEHRFVILVIGGSLGAKRLNDLVISAAADLVYKLPSVYIIHLSGHNLYKQVLAGYSGSLGIKASAHVKVIDYSNELENLSSIADLVVSRAGATTLAELALQGKAVISVPNPNLTGGHQLKNSSILASSGAVLEFFEDGLPADLAKQILSLANDSRARQELSARLSKTAKPDASSKLADIIIKVAKKV